MCRLLMDLTSKVVSFEKKNVELKLFELNHETNSWWLRAYTYKCWCMCSTETRIYWNLKWMEWNWFFFSRFFILSFLESIDKHKCLHTVFKAYFYTENYWLEKALIGYLPSSLITLFFSFLFLYFCDCVHSLKETKTWKFFNKLWWFNAMPCNLRQKYSTHRCVCLFSMVVESLYHDHSYPFDI